MGLLGLMKAGPGRLISMEKEPMIVFFLEPPDVQALVGTKLDCAAWVGREIFYYKLDGRCYSITCLSALSRL